MVVIRQKDVCKRREVFWKKQIFYVKLWTTAGASESAGTTAARTAETTGSALSAGTHASGTHTTGTHAGSALLTACIFAAKEVETVDYVEHYV